MPTVREYEAALAKNPADSEAFIGLRKAFRQSKEFDRLITLYETRAQAITDGPKAAELFYLAAELRFDQLSDAVGAEADLANAVHRDPGHIRAAARLKDLYREQGRTIQYMEMLEMEAAAVARSRDPSRLEDLAAEMGQLFVNHFDRLEKAVRSAQRPSKLATEDLKTIESARKIYRALGDFRSVVRLYELELEATSDPKRRADLLFGLGRVLAALIAHDLVGARAVDRGHRHRLPAGSAHREPRGRLVAGARLSYLLEQTGARGAVTDIDLADRRVDHLYRRLIFRQDTTAGTARCWKSGHGAKLYADSVTRVRAVPAAGRPVWHTSG